MVRARACVTVCVCERGGGDDVLPDLSSLVDR